MMPSAPELAKLPSAQTAPQPPRKRKGPKGPNPLSVKKKKAAPTPALPKNLDAGKVEVGKKRKAHDDDGDDRTVKSPGETGHKRKRRRRTNAQSTEQSKDDT